MSRLRFSLARFAAIAIGGFVLTVWSQTTPPPPTTVPAPAPETSPAAGPIALSGVRSFSPEAYHSDRQNWAIVEDNRGILYFGNTTGVLEFDGVRWRKIELPDGQGAFALGRTADGRILVGGQGEVGWLAPDPAGTMVYVSKAADLPDAFRSTGDRVIQILDTPAGQVYLSDHWLLVRAANGVLSTVGSADHFLSAAWFHDALYVLDSGRGLTRFDGGTLKDVAGGANMRSLTMIATSAGLLIPSYNDGLVRYTPDAASPWKILNSANWGQTDGAEVSSAVTLNENLFALGTTKQGVALIDADGQILERIGPAQGLADDHIYSINYDRNGGLWLALDNGLALIGLNLPKGAGAPPFSASVREVVGTKDEHLIFGGAFFTAPGGVQQGEQGVNQRPEFKFNYNAFRYQYAANGIEASGDMQFQTFVQGVDNNWTAWTDRTEREFTQLSPGRWVFRVRARKSNGEMSAEGVYLITIIPAWYNTWWFLVAQIVFVFAILLLPGHTPHPHIQEALTTFAVIVPFIYIGNWLSDMVNHYYSTDIAFIQVLISALLALLLDPLQNFLKGHVQRRNQKHHERRRQRHRHRHPELYTSSDQPDGEHEHHGHHEGDRGHQEHHDGQHDRHEHHEGEHGHQEHHEGQHGHQEHHEGEHAHHEHHDSEHGHQQHHSDQHDSPDHHGDPHNPSEH
jgi:hypothetical protein